MSKKRGQGKAARRAKDCIRLFRQNKSLRGFKLAKKRGIKIAFTDIGNGPPNHGSGWGFVEEYGSNKEAYARILR